MITKITPALLASLAGLSAAPITWGPATAVATGTGNSSDVSTSGTPVEAFHAQGADKISASPVVNGVTFVGTTFLLPGTLGTGTNDFSSATNAGDSSYDALLSDAEFGGGGSEFAISIGGNALTTDTMYEVQIWFVDDRAAQDGRVMNFGDGHGNTVGLNDQYAIGSFIADGPSQTLTLDAVDFGNAHINAYQLRQAVGNPLVTLSTAADPVTAPYLVDVVFNEEVTGLADSDFVVINGIASGVTPAIGPASAYTVTITPAATGSVTVVLPADKVIDGESNPNVVSDPLSTFYLAPGADQPEVTLTTASSTVNLPYTVDVAFTEAVSGLELTDFELTNGTASGFTGSGADYSILVTPFAEGDVTVILPAGRVTDTDEDMLPNPVSNSLVTTYHLPDAPTVSIYGATTAATPGYEVFLSFSEEVGGLTDGDFQVVNGSASGTTGSGRFWSTTITAASPGAVEVRLPAGAVTDLDGDNDANLVSNTHLTQCTSDFGERWIVDDQASWTAATGTLSNITISGGYAEPSADSSQFSSATRTFPEKMKAVSLTLTQSPVWENWISIANVQPSGAGDAPVLVPAGPDNYYLLALGSTNGYHAWWSNDMVNWVHRGPVTPPTTGRWVTSAEYKDGSFYIYSDYYNDHTPRLFIDDNLDDGIVGTDMGAAFVKEASGSDCSLIRNDEDGLFHLIYEDWSPINAREHSWDSPLAGHTSSADGLNGFLENKHQHPVDHRTTPTGTYGTYNHPNVPGETYEIHTPEQDAFGDWTSVKIGSRWFLFSDFHPAGETIRLARFASDSIYKPFEFTGSMHDGHPDPTVGFAEGQFYLITQQATDYRSPGPWVEGVEARAGVDTDGDGGVDEWTSWQTVSEQYDYTPNFIRVVDLTPARVDMSALSPGFGFGFEFRVDDTVVSAASPIMDAVEMSFAPSNFQQWSNDLGIPAEANGDYNSNSLSNLIEFALGQSSMPERQPDGSLTLTATSEALEDGYAVELQFSEDLKLWTTATQSTAGVKLLNTTTLPDGDEEARFEIFAPNGNYVFWRIVVN